jgi:hypothetical protein
MDVLDAGHDALLEVARIWRSTERTNLEKKPAPGLSQEAYLGARAASTLCEAMKRDYKTAALPLS